MPRFSLAVTQAVSRVYIRMEFGLRVRPYLLIAVREGTCVYEPFLQGCLRPQGLGSESSPTDSKNQTANKKWKQEVSSAASFSKTRR